MILGQSKAVLELNQLIKQVAPSKANVLIMGESGTGKELVARSIHEQSQVSGMPFVAVNCGAIAENLIESELFGHVRGSFTGAISDKMGLFQAAHGGTLFLDEVGELPLQTQVKLLRAIQERAFRKLGGVEDVRVDVRIVSATNCDLEEGIRIGAFREDLFYRLNVIMIRTPALRHREGDVQYLAKHFLHKFVKMKSQGIEEFTDEVLSLLESYSWPGNVRELENTIERAIALESSHQITAAALPDSIRYSKVSHHSGSDEEIITPSLSSPGFKLEMALSVVEKSYIKSALLRSKSNEKDAARILGVTQKSLKEAMKKYRL